MKNKVLIGLMMMSCFFVVNGMDVDTLEFETNGDNSSDKTLEIFNKEHPEFIQLLSEDHRDNVIKIMQEKRQNLVSHVMSNKESISSQELTKQYGNNALDYFKLGGITFSNRIIRSATFEGMSDENGKPTEQLIKKYEALAMQTEKVRWKQHGENLY